MIWTRGLISSDEFHASNDIISLSLAYSIHLWTVRGGVGHSQISELSQCKTRCSCLTLTWRSYGYLCVKPWHQPYFYCLSIARWSRFNLKLSTSLSCLTRPLHTLGISLKPITPYKLTQVNQQSFQSHRQSSLSPADKIRSDRKGWEIIFCMESL